MSNQIEELDVKELKEKSKNKKLKVIAKKTLIGVLATSFVFSLIPSFKYNISKYKAQNDIYITEVLESDKPTEVKMEELYKDAINKNNNLDDQTKKDVIAAFTDVIIKPSGRYFSNENLLNMYAVANTEKIKKLDSFTLKHGWWSGSYIPLYNTFTYNNFDKEIVTNILAHEQLHAILRTRNIDTGFTNMLLNGYGLNEGATAALCIEPGGYIEEKMLFENLSLILGYDNMLSYYFDGNLNALKKELTKYISYKDANKFITNIDNIVFCQYADDFLVKNKIVKDASFIENKIKSNFLECKEIMKEIINNKYNEESNLYDYGQFLLNSTFYKDSYDMNDKDLYTLSLNKDNTIKCSLFNHDFVNLNVNKNINYLSQSDMFYNKLNEDLRKQQLSCPHFDYNQIDSHSTKVNINSASCLINMEELDKINKEYIINKMNNGLNNIDFNKIGEIIFDNRTNEIRNGLKTY